MASREIGVHTGTLVRMSSANPRVTSPYTIFFLVIVLSAFSAIVPQSITPNYSWWLAAIAILVLMVIAGWVGAQRESTHWLNTAAPLLVLPAMHALRCSDGNSASGFAALVLLPVLWFALYGRLRDVVIAIVGGAVALTAPIVIVGAPQFPSTTWRGPALLIVVTATLGPLIYQLAHTTTRANNALLRSEREFRAAFEDAPVGMAITGLHGAEAFRFVRVNRALCEMFGRSAHELTSVPVAELTHPDDVDKASSAMAMPSDPSVPHRVELRYLHKSGRTIWAKVSYSPINDESGVPSHLISQIEDVSARRESDQVLLDAFETDREATDRLKRMERIRAEMASIISHELRTPLTSAAGYVELLVEGDAGPLTDEQLSMLDTVMRNLKRLDGIVDDVLGKASSDQPEVREVGTADLGSVLAAAVRSVSLQAATRGHDVITRNSLNGARAIGDAGRLERVLVNLLTNAVKFTPEDGVITITGKREKDQASISIADTGIGISSDDQKRIFDRFFRADNSADSPTSGTGLGLAIVQTITTQFGGTITVDSALGMGSTFTLTVPLQPNTA